MKKISKRIPLYNFYFYLILLLISVSNTIVSSQSYWTRIKSPVNTSLRNCVFIDNQNGWAAGDNGVIIHTSNGGNTFQIQNSGITFNINDIFFMNNRLGWAVANEFAFTGTTILTTTNGGINWSSEIFPDTSKFFRTIYFLDSLKGFIGGFGGSIYKTTNAGGSWFAASVDTSEFSGFPISRIIFSSANTGFACGGIIDVAGVIWKTTDGGLNWFAGSYSPEPFFDFYVIDQSRLISAGGDFEYGVQISKTSNAGVNWKYSSLQLFGQAYSIDFRTPKEAWIASGYSRNWAVSYDSGNSWINLTTTDSAELYSVDFTDSTHGWAVGNNGVILKYVPFSVSVYSENKNIPVALYLSQNYPNPFNPVTHFEFEISPAIGGLGFVSLKIYDVRGNEIATLVNEKKNAGKHSVVFDAGKLSSGIYFYILRSGNNSLTKKMVIIK